MAEGIVQYWLNYVRLQSKGSYVWDYAHRTTLNNADRVEDSSHAHIDVGFLILAYEWGVGGLTAEDMTRLAAAALMLSREDEEVLLLVLPSDHVITFCYRRPEGSVSKVGLNARGLLRRISHRDSSPTA